MAEASTARDVIVGVSPAERPNARLVTAVCQAGGLGVLDLGAGDRWATTALDDLAGAVPGPFGVRVPAGCALPPDVLDRANIDTVVLGVDAPWPVAQLAARYRVLVEVTDLDGARAAATAGAHGLVARGTEAGGGVGDLSSFVLLQRLLAADAPRLPVWVAGGIGLRTAAASVIGGAA